MLSIAVFKLFLFVNDNKEINLLAINYINYYRRHQRENLLSLNISAKLV